jgi:hypothetical protein
MYLPVGVKGSQCRSLTTSLPTVSWLSIRYGRLDISQPYGPPWPLTSYLTIRLLHYCNFCSILSGSLIVLLEDRSMVLLFHDTATLNPFRFHRAVTVSTHLLFKEITTIRTLNLLRMNSITKLILIYSHSWKSSHTLMWKKDNCSLIEGKLRELSPGIYHSVGW